MLDEKIARLLRTPRVTQKRPRDGGRYLHKL